MDLETAQPADDAVSALKQRHCNVRKLKQSITSERFISTLKQRLEDERV